MEPISLFPLPDLRSWHVIHHQILLASSPISEYQERCQHANHSEGGRTQKRPQKTITCGFPQTRVRHPHEGKILQRISSKRFFIKRTDEKQQLVPILSPNKFQKKRSEHHLGIMRRCKKTVPVQRLSLFGTMYKLPFCHTVSGGQTLLDIGIRRSTGYYESLVGSEKGKFVF
ncbi:hypothetical protein JTE90_027436 [Oedothorax gibbosus]|uniref:Uncharacterized protein n=1 Tax=Oedothorax gibbosus TaxID=931172 RepID=A0AAV6W4A4_9ARAC|nr:hypothetical protein JTE90_027436 [Oedothorax gibbosus]